MKDLHDLSILDHLLKNSLTSPEPICDFRQWKRVWALLVPKWETPIERALAGGLSADRPAWAFAAGYQAAIQGLTLPLGMSDAVSLSAICITETAGAHPARIESRLAPIPEKPGCWRLDGHKTLITGAEEDDVLWVVASTGKTANGRNQLRMERGPSRSPGVALSTMPPLDLVPEIPHAAMRFASVALNEEAILKGDACLKMIKPFRSGFFGTGVMEIDEATLRKGLSGTVQRTVTLHSQ